ncbi:hypothetical protein [Consotaella aegiceratis]|uniref:hypothetical protein n=1 Tax=Consotaella aegiceratis TaxID=3097961 RepID=UPI002F3EC8F3
MTISTRAAQQAANVFRPESDRHEKGSAMGLIAADSAATHEKTERLRALRLAKEAQAPSEEPVKTKARSPRGAKARRNG